MSKRYPHYLQPATAGRLHDVILCVDCDSHFSEKSTNMIKHEIVDGWSAAILKHDCDNYTNCYHHRGNSVQRFWLFLSRQLRENRSVMVISYNCSRVWSLLELWAEIESNRLRLLPDPVQSGSPLEVHGRRINTGYLVCEDPPCILSGRIDGCSGKITWIDARNFSATRPVNCTGSVNTIKWLTSWTIATIQICNELKLGSLQSTVASQAMHGFRHAYLTSPVYCHNSTQVLELESAAYIGGRCEAFRLGLIDGPVWHLDFRAMYPSVCLHSQLPCRLVGINNLLKTLVKIFNGHSNSVIADVTIITNEPAYPFRRECDIIWPIGTFRTVLATPELLDALNLNRIVAVHSVAEYECDNVLSEYMHAVLKQRKVYETDGNSDASSLCKALGNALVGKLGQRNIVWEHDSSQWTDLMYGEWVGSDINGEMCRYRSIAGIVQQRVHCGWHYDAVPAIAATVTSAARMALLGAIRNAGWNNVYYVDTDSLFVSEKGYIRLCQQGYVRNGVDGYLTVKEGPINVEIRGIKYYIASGKTVCAGIPRGENIDCGDGLHYWRQSSATDAIRERRVPSASKRLHAYSRTGQYRHRRVNNNGTTEPWTLPEA